MEHHSAATLALVSATMEAGEPVPLAVEASVMLEFSEVLALVLALEVCLLAVLDSWAHQVFVQPDPVPVRDFFEDAHST
jgi:hypothetical protein